MRNVVSRSPVLAGMIAGLSIAATPAGAEVAVGLGRSVTLATMSSVDQVCHSQGQVSISVLEQPHGGTLEVEQVRAYPNFNALNTRSRCNTIKLPATRLTYTSDGSFLGLDFVTIEAVFPEGAVKRYRFPISVRPVATPLAPQIPAPNTGAQNEGVKPAPKKAAKAKVAAPHAREAAPVRPQPARPDHATKPEPNAPVYTPI